MARDVTKYVIDGQRCLSVTEALQLTGWVSFDGVPTDVLERARCRGIYVHDATLLIDERDLDMEAVPEEWRPYCRAYEQFLIETKVEMVLREQSMVCESHRFGVTPDCDAILNGAPAVIELKTSESVEPWWGLQTAAQDLALGGGRRRFSLRLRRDGSYRLDPHTDDNDLGLFLAALTTAQGQVARGVAQIPEEFRD